ncbi:amidohydrolase family protein [Acuticoccus mangrovi]|uniref:Amidohydrolase family protein n=1 Tax=Acuticoccus mangrovi TaxID=2796142 RepID=A0A934INP9_9HYPH|nr:amidohydrolase family protein [Acuticoccus mangrovi]MBJ3775552.1 amidohydrolase family protein [Acuticoccus mangrovi]
MPPAANRFLVTGARVLAQDADVDMPPVADVLVEDGLIRKIGDLHAVEDVTRVDLAGHLLAPGFVNAHYHSHDVLAKGSFERLTLERWALVSGAIGAGRSEAEVRLRTLLGAVECLKNGITTVQDFATLNPLTPLIDVVANAYASAGVRVILSPTVRDLSQADSILWINELASDEEARVVGRTAPDGPTQLAVIGEAMDRIGDRGGLIRWAVSPSAPQRCSFEFLQAIDRFRRERRLPVYTHLYETRLQRLFADQELARFGGSAVTMMQEAGLLDGGVSFAHCIWIRPEEVRQLADAGAGVILNMLSNLKLRSGIAPIRALREAGIPLSLGCDNCSCSDVQSMLQVMKLYCLLSGVAGETGGPEAAEAIGLATTAGARTAGLQGRIGTLAPGMAADMVAYDLSDIAWQPLNSVARQLVFAETGRAIRHVWVAGQPRVWAGRCAPEIEAEIADQLARLMPGVRTDLAALSARAATMSDVFSRIDQRLDCHFDLSRLPFDATYQQRERSQ